MVTGITHSQTFEKNDNSNSKQNKEIPWYIAGAAGGATGSISGAGSAILAKNLMAKDCRKLSQYVTPDIVNKTMNLADIKKLGITIDEAIWDGATDSLVKMIKKDAKNYNNKSLFGKFIHKIKKMGVNYMRKQHLEPIQGKNAFYYPGFDSILLNTKKGGAYVFHELGHAKNYNSNNKAMKYLIKMKNPLISSLLTTAGMLCAFIPRAEGEEAETFWGKTKNFLKDSSVGITAVGALATPLEEGIASIRGASIAKKILPKDQLKMVNKMNTKGFLSYLAVAAGTILTTYIIKKLTDTNKSEQTLSLAENNKFEKEAELSLRA